MRWPGQTFPIAVDFDDQELFALQLNQHKRHYRINGWFRHDIAQGGESAPGDLNLALTEALRQLRRTRGFKGRRVAMHLPADKLICFPSHLNVQKNGSTDGAVFDAARKNLPYDVKEAVIDYPSLGENTPDGPETAMICAARRRDVMDAVSAMTSAGFSVDVMDFLPLSILRLHQRFWPSMDGPAILCHVGRNQSSLMVIHDDQIHVLSKFKWGRDNLVASLDNALGLENRQTALHLLKTFGVATVQADTQDKKVAENTHRIIGPAIETLVFEFQKVLGYTRAKKTLKSINMIFFYGLSDQIHGLADYIQATLNIPADGESAMDRIADMVPDFFKQSEPAGLFTPSLGLALRTIPWL